MRKHKLSVVSYINSIPFIKGIRSGPVSESLDIMLDVPSECARKIIASEADIGLVPAVTIPKVADGSIVSSFCIGADGPVKSVVLVSNNPLDEIEKILLDHESNTSVMLARILAKEYWHVDPKWSVAEPGFERMIGDKEGAVIIGDRALAMASKYRFVYDLAYEWKKFTGLPFVFAVWLSNISLPDSFLQSFENSLESGINEIESYCRDLIIPGSEFNACDYLTRFISYDLNTEKKEGLKLFLEKLENLELSEEQVI